MYPLSFPGHALDSHFFLLFCPSVPNPWLADPMCSILYLFLLNFTTFLFCHFFILLRSLWMATHWQHALVWCCPLIWWGCTQSPLVLNFIKNKLWNVKLLDKNSLRKTIINISFMLKEIIFGCPLCMLCDLYNFPRWKEKKKKDNCKLLSISEVASSVFQFSYCKGCIIRGPDFY